MPTSVCHPADQQAFAEELTGAMTALIARFR
jgi:hypothetical protein